VNIKGLLFILFLYVCLAWVGAALLVSGHRIQEVGLTWTAAGLIVLFAFVIGAHLLRWWRFWRARRTAVRQASPAKPKQAIHEDDAALAALIAEANATLAKAPAYAGKAGGTPLSSLPLYLLIGPEGSGKTSTFINSGLEPQLLAGQISGTTPLVSTRLCNIWLAKNAAFVEISGRAFAGDLGRWTQLLRVLQGRAPVPLWRRLWGESESGWALRGVVGICDIKEVSASSADPERSTLSCRQWEERLRAVGEVFGAGYPVYFVFTKCDAIPFFPDFFRRLPDGDTNQVLGCALAARKVDAAEPAEAPLQAEIKRLTASFRTLYQALAERRVTHLAHEPDLAKRPAIYEFPRELKKIRSPLVQFLADVVPPRPLQPGPLLRGYYFTAVREVEAGPPDAGASRADWSVVNVGMDGTRLFRSDTTQVARQGEFGGNWNIGRGRLTLRWIFVSDLFLKVVLADPPLQKSVPADSRIQLYRRAAFAGLGCVCVLLAIAFCWSWTGNQDLLQGVERAGALNFQKTGRPATINELRSLEALRVQVARLTAYKRKGAPWSLRWGLYSGDRVIGPARKAYFRGFQQLLLNDLNGSIVAKLAAVTATPGPNDPYQPVYDLLNTHLTISTAGCKPEPALVARVMKETELPAAQAAGLDWQALAEAQIDFYAEELPHGNPLPLAEDDGARDRARAYLQQIHGVARIYASILANAEEPLKQPLRLRDLAPNYNQVLSGSSEVSSIFTPGGWAYVEKASTGANAGQLGDPCVMGLTSGAGRELRQDPEVAGALRGLFVRDYVEHWKKFLQAFSVARYAGAGDAARRLDILASHNSPLLALLYMTSTQTYFPKPAGADGIQTKLENMPLINRVFKGAKKAAANLSGSQIEEPSSSPAAILRVFQPVHYVVPPGSVQWVVEQNSAYIDSLQQLRHSMQDIARGAGNPDPAVHQTASQNYDKALDAVRQIAREFKPVGEEGVDEAVQRLLEEPIRLTNGYIIRDMEGQGIARVNGEMHALCGSLRNTLRKYPFQASSSDDTSLDELASWFHPALGRVWKFEAQTLGELVVKDGSQWKLKDPTKKPQVRQEVLAFFNRAQSVSDAFYPAGVSQPQLTYILRPQLDPSFGSSTLELELDGRLYQWTSSLQKQFTWPAPADAKILRATARIRSGSVAVGFASRGGLWGIFRIMGDAEPRALNSKLVEWKNSRGADGLLVPIQPAPVRLDIVEFPGGTDVFNPRFYQGLTCPDRAVQ
jgi:type VI secretion system protein ImpL